MSRVRTQDCVDLHRAMDQVVGFTGLVVIGGDSRPRGGGFAALDTGWTFFTFIVVNIVVFV